MKEADQKGRGYLDFDDFRHFVALLKARPEVTALYEAAKGPPPHGHEEFTFVVFEHFMRTCQYVSIPFSPRAPYPRFELLLTSSLPLW